LHKLAVKESKAQWMKTRVNFLGHVVGEGHLAPQSSKVEAVKNFPKPITVSDLRGFLGLVGYYRKFIYNFADKATPLNDLLKKDSDMKMWCEEQDRAFAKLKECLMEAPVLVLADTKGARDGSRPFHIQTDASGSAMGAVLMQDHGKGLQPVAFASKTFNPAETNYNTTERELRALVWATTEMFYMYVYGTSYKLQGDHRPLATLLEPGRELSRRQARWVEKLQEHGVPKMEYVAGKFLPVPDALSRPSGMLATTPSPREGLAMLRDGTSIFLGGEGSG
jgi:hypothetical protein